MIWFIHSNEKILGPFSIENILERLQSGDLSYEGYIWSKGQAEWVALADWETNIEKYRDLNNESEKSWKVRTPNGTQGDLEFQEVLAFLKRMKSYEMVAVAPNDSNEWTPLYSSFAFMEALKLSRRNFLRAPLMGLAKVTRSTSRFSYVVKTSTIGQGGIGIFGLGTQFEAGTKVQLRVESEDLNAPLNLTGAVVYSSDKGHVGIKFEDVPAESNAVILDYMKRFTDPNSKDVDGAA